jgi:hypothetical protein
MAYDKSDPRSTLSNAKSSEGSQLSVNAFFGASYGKFYDTVPQEVRPLSKTWITRGQNFVICYSEVEAGATFERSDQVDEYVVLSPEKEVAVEITAEDGSTQMPGYALAFVPPGKSSIRALNKGRIVRMFTSKAADLAAKANNAADFTGVHPNVPPFQAWPDPPEGFKVRWYTLDVEPQEGRFGRIYRCTTFMVNYLDERRGARDKTKVSPHHHDDFEQCSLALHGAYTHHLRWPWTTDMTIWRDDVHDFIKAPSAYIIPPPSIHTSTYEDPNLNQLVDIFSPPRADFSAKPGWVLNEKDYPAPKS